MSWKCLLDPALTLATALHAVPQCCLLEGDMQQAVHDGIDDSVVDIDEELGAVGTLCAAVRADGYGTAPGSVGYSMMHD